MVKERSENIDDLNSDAAELRSRYLIPIAIMVVIVLGGLGVFFYFMRKKLKSSPLAARKVGAPTIRQTDIDVIEEVDEESSSGIEITVGKQATR